MSLVVVKRMGLPHRDKENLYLLVTILGDPILYRDGIIWIETGLVKVEIKGRKIVTSFNILLLGKDKAVLGIPFLKEFNPRINWVIRQVKIRDTKRRKAQQQTKAI